MKERLLELVRSAPTPLHARNAVREYLQARILGSMQRAGAMVPLAFLGGTALRFLYTIQRYSEDLDFALERNRNSYDFRAYLRSIRADFEAEGYVRKLAQRGGRSTAQAGLGSCPQRRPPADRDRRRLAPAHVGQYAPVTQRTA